MKTLALKMNNPKFGMIQDEERYKNIIKGLQLDTPYYFYKNYKLTNDNRLMKCVQNHPFMDHFYNPLGKNDDFSLNVCAIVGKNGCGKSSIIEIIIRIINNFACSIIGDSTKFNSAQPLHFVPDIFCELYYEINNTIYKLQQVGNEIHLYQSQVEKSLYSNTYNGTEWENNQIAKLKESKLKHIFYTIVINYSHYSYNLYDYEPEWNSLEFMKTKLNQEEQERRKKVGEPEVFDVERCWLTGIFHKNDGYQTPIVLNPFRYDGNINIKKESDLERDRFLSLILSSDYNNQNILEEVIDDKKIGTIDITINKDHSTIDPNYRTEKLKSFYEQFKRETIPAQKVFNEIIVQWSNFYGIDFRTNLFGDGLDDLHDLAINYLIYKTLKITRQYNEYSYLYPTLTNNSKSLSETINNLVKKIDEDKSHISLKIRQTISFLLCNHISIGKKQKIEDISHKMNQNLNEDWEKKIQNFRERSKQSLHLTDADEGVAKDFNPDMIDMVPPPFFNVELNLIAKKKKDKNKNRNFKFSTLSSGEKQMIYTVSSILYHLKNINSVQYRRNTHDIYYPDINIILEEIEQYYHPEMQRRLLYYIISRIQELKLNTRSIQIILVTHSPFILSDIPVNNILYLEEGSPYKKEMPETFGANIFELLKDSFFLKDGPLGVHSYKILTDIFQKINGEKLSQPDLKAIENMCKYIGEPFLKEELMKLIELKKRKS